MGDVAAGVNISHAERRWVGTQLCAAHRARGSISLTPLNLPFLTCCTSPLGSCESHRFSYLSALLSILMVFLFLLFYWRSVPVSPARAGHARSPCAVSPCLPWAKQASSLSARQWGHPRCTPHHRLQNPAGVTQAETTASF